jgi:hypothetical protein
MKETIGGISNEYCYLNPCDFTNITTTTSLTGTSGSYAFNTTTDILYNYTYVTGDNIINNQNNGTGIISSNTTAGSPIISLDSNYFKSGLIKNLLDRIIEIRSLIKNNSFYEIFNIKKISFLKDKTKIVCTKDIDIDYLNELKSESILLLECIDVPNDNYKEKAINGNMSSFLNGNNTIWGTDYNSINTITINPYVINQDNFNWTYGTNNNITYTA